MSSRGSFVVVVGPDGVGKTTLAAEIITRLGDKSAYFHFIPSPLRPLSAQPPEAGALTAKSQGSGGRTLGILRVVRNIIRAWMGYAMAIRPAIRRGTTVVGDRWIYGYLAQPRPLEFYGPTWIARAALRLAPRPDLVVLLEAPGEVVHSRKPELTAPQVESEVLRWRRAVPTALRLDATRPPGELVDVVLGQVYPRTLFRRYPPALGHILLPEAPRSAAVQGSSLYTATRLRALIAHRGGRALLHLIGTAWLAAARREGMPISPESWAALLRSLRARGFPVTTVALHTRTQSERNGFSMLLIESTGVTAFVRVAELPVLDAECRALSLLETAQPGSFAFPRLLMRDTCGALSIAAYSVVLSGFHRPARRPPLGEIVSDIQRALAPLPRPQGTPLHWMPIHGDLTPWNLRECHGTVSLVDWEAVGWGPPHADEVLYAAAARALRLPEPGVSWDEEAVTFWVSRLRQPQSTRDATLHKALLRAMGR